MKAFVTGGIGFIGSHIVDSLLEQGYKVTVYDNFSTGREDYLFQHKNNPKLKIIRGDILNLSFLTEYMASHEFVFHLAANADVRGGINNTRVDLEQNTLGTWNVLEAMRLNNIKKIAFSSSATIYGEPEVFPTPESYAPIQTSLYGASKYACEAMIQAYTNYYGMQAWIFRFVSWIGERYSHGVVFDFIKKLKKDPKRLEILGDGTQRKSYLYVKDGIDAIMHAIANFNQLVNIFNIGHTDYFNVIEVADIVVREMGLKDVKYHFMGGKRGWKGDSPFVHLDVSKLTNTGWKPKTPIREGIKKTARYLLDNGKVLERS